MKPEYTPLNKLHADTGPHKVRVRVIEKCRPRTSANNKKFQNFTVTDELGNKMRATLFNEDIDAYESIIKLNGLYEIANPTIKPLPQRFQTYPDEHQMTLNGSTTIHTIEQPILSDGPHYHSIASIPKTSGSDDRIYILGIVLFVEPIREVNGIQGRPVDVREIVITDSSSPRTMTISLWNDLAHRGTNMLEKWAENQSIVGFLSVRPTGYKGFSLASTMSTEFVPHPTGERAAFLLKWQQDNKELLRERLERIRAARNPNADNKIFTIAEVKAKKADKVMQEEKMWIKIRIPVPDYFELRPYVACNYCAKQTRAVPGTQLACQNCNKDNAKAIARASFTFEATDDTGLMKLTAFGEPLEQLLKVTCAEIYELQKKEEVTKLHQITKAIEDVTFFAQLTPANSLSKNGVLKWVLRAVKPLSIPPGTSPDADFVTSATDIAPSAMTGTGSLPVHSHSSSSNNASDETCDEQPALAPASMASSTDSRAIKNKGKSTLADCIEPTSQIPDKFVKDNLEAGTSSKKTRVKTEKVSIVSVQKTPDLNTVTKAP